VAVLKSDEVSEKEYTSCLSTRERAKLGSIKNKKRSREWLAGRLAAKYLFLNQPDMPLNTQPEPWRPALLRLRSENLRSLSPWIYRRIEVLPSSTKQSGYPRMSWCGKDSARDISMSHIAGMACACISRQGAIGVDLEIPVPRVDSFYRGNFTRSERNWVDQHSGNTSISSEWLYTFLWTLKEATLKSAGSNKKSVWDIPGIEIRSLTSPTNILESYSNEQLSNNFQLLKVQINNHNKSIWAQVALTATRNLILTVLMIREGQRL
jgi:phosphopantetheinyl transferase